MKTVVFVKAYHAGGSRSVFYAEGTLVSLPDSQAEQLIAQGYAVERGEPQLETKDDEE